MLVCRMQKLGGNVQKFYHLFSVVRWVLRQLMNYYVSNFEDARKHATVLINVSDDWSERFTTLPLLPPVPNGREREKQVLIQYRL